MASTLPELRRIAAASVAVSLWNHIDDLSRAAWRENNKSNYLDELLSFVVVLTKMIELPKSMTELIEEYVTKIQEELFRWASYHNNTIFFDSDERRLFCHLSHFVWHPNCTIDYKRTALKLQNSLRLSEVDKFRLLCQYCLKEEIERKWKLLYENKIYVSIHFEANPLIYYWDRYCRNKLQDIPAKNLPIDEFMFQLDCVDNWPAKEYFFDRMSIHGQVRSAIFVIDRHGVMYQKLVIMKLSQFQRSELFIYRPMQVLMNFIRSPANSDDILPVWREMTKRITKENFELILNELIRDKVDGGIIAEIWVTASDTLKLHALETQPREFIRWIWDPWMKFYEYDSFSMLLDTSKDIRDEIKTMPMFNDHCLYLMRADRLPVLEKMLNLCFPRVDELAAVRRTLAQTESFRTHCENLITAGKLTKLEELLNFFCSITSVEQSVQFKKSLTAEKFFGYHCHELIAREDFYRLTNLLRSFLPTVKDSARFRRGLKNIFGDYCQKIITGDLDLIALAKMNSLSHFYYPEDEERARFKNDLGSRKFFDDHCEKLIINGEFSMLEKLSEWLYPRPEESVRFRRCLTRKEFFDDICQRLIINDEFSSLNVLYDSFLFTDLEDLTRFKRDFARKEFFLNYCLDSIIRDRLPTFVALLNLFFPYADELTTFKKDLLRQERFFKHCLRLIENKQISELELLFNSCFSDLKEIKMLKKNLIRDKTFVEHCQNLIDSHKLTNLHELLTWSFPDQLELDRFKSDLAYSENVKERCMILYLVNDATKLNDLWALLFLPQFKKIYVYQRHLLLSEIGIKICFENLIHQSKIQFENMIKDWLHPSTKVADFKKEMIFSPPAIARLKKMLRKNFANVKKCFDWFLASDEDKDDLKMRLLDTSVAQIAMFFFKSNKSVGQSMIEWWLPTKTAIHECKCKILVNEIFEAGLKECVFHEFSSCGRVSRCILKKDFDLEPLDRFLEWYFGCPQKVKEYKIRKIDAYENMETISVLLEKGCKFSYFDKLLNWFFENDAVRMAKFKKDHEGEKIENIMNRHRSRKLFSNELEIILSL